MPKAYKKISVELYSENCTAFLKTAVMQNDANSRFLNVTLLMNGSKWEAPQGAIVTFQFKRPDGYNTSSWGTVEEDGTISVEIIDVMSQVGGEGLANIQIVTNEDDGQGGTNPSSLSSMPFIVQICEQVTPPDTIIESDEFDALVQALSEVAGFAGVRTEVENARGTYGTVGERLDDVDTDLNTHTGDIASLGGRLTTAEQSIGTLDSGLTGALQRITDNEEAISGMQDDISNIVTTHATDKASQATKDNAQDVQLSMLTQQLADANKVIANMSDDRVTVDGGYDNVSALPKTAAVAAMNSILYGMTVTPLVAQAAVAVGGTVSFASVLNSKYYDSLHKTILTGTGSTMTITNDTAAVANINVIDLTAFGLATLTAAQCQAAFPSFFTGTQSAQVTCIEATGKNLFDAQRFAKNTPVTYEWDGNFLTVKRSDGVAWENAPVMAYLIAGVYSFSRDNNAGRVQLRVSSDNYSTNILTLENGITQGTFTMTQNGWIKVKVGITAGTYPQKYKVQLERNAAATDYEPYKLEEQYIEPYNLRSHADGTTDTVDTAKNEYIKRLDDSGVKLAEPIITQGIVTGNLLSRPNGTIQFGNKHSFTSMVVDGKLPTRTNYADIAAIERLEKLNADGTLAPLDITLATIAADKRSISHPQLANGAIARCKYAYSFGGVNGRKDISYVTGANLVTDSVTGKVYKVGKAIADGVMTDTMTEVV